MKTLENVFNSEKFIVRNNGKVTEEKNIIKEYSNFLKNKIGNVNGKIVVDFLGGAGVKAIEIFKEMGLDIIPLHDKPDASLYGFHRLEPWGELLNTAKETVKKEKADFGVAFDCDADRSVFISSAGKYVDSSIINGIFIKNILKIKKGKIVATFNCASELENFSKNLGGKLIWFRIGHSFIEEKIVEENALFAGEESSHFYFNEIYPFSDGILSTLYLSKILKETNRKFDELIKEIKFHPIESLYINAKTDENKIKVVEKLREKYPNSIDIMDGFKIKLNDIEWVLIRTSNTLPEVNLCVEAKNKKRLKELISKYSEIIKKQI